MAEQPPGVSGEGELIRPHASVGPDRLFVRVLDWGRLNISGPERHLAHAVFIVSCYECKTAGCYIDLGEFCRPTRPVVIATGRGP